MSSPNFDRVARVYRWAEYGCLGRALEHCRYRFLANTAGCRRALVLGDGDGRFTARLLEENPQVEVDAVDLSGEMLRLLRRRCGSARVRTHQADALAYEVTGEPDLVVAHFFFDCLEQAELDGLIVRIAANSEPDAVWVVSEFRVPEGLLRWPARIYIGLLYAAFGVLTGLRVRRLPDHAAALRAAGLELVAGERSLFGLLTAEVWQRREGLPLPDAQKL